MDLDELEARARIAQSAGVRGWAAPAAVFALIERVRRAEADYQDAREQLGRQAAVWWRLEQEKTTALVSVSAALGEDIHITLLDVGERVRDRIARLERLRESAADLRARWPEGGCVVEPACGDCAWCRFAAALDAAKAQP